MPVIEIFLVTICVLLTVIRHTLIAIRISLEKQTEEIVAAIEASND